MDCDCNCECEKTSMVIMFFGAGAGWVLIGFFITYFSYSKKEEINNRVELIIAWAARQ